LFSAGSLLRTKTGAQGRVHSLTASNTEQEQREQGKRKVANDKNTEEKE